MATKILVFLAVLVLSVVPASADCSATTITTSDGRILTCSTCCLGGSCATTCTR